MTVECKKRLLIVDPTLSSAEGHSLHYDLAVAERFKGRFDDIILFADRRFTVPVNFKIKCQPVLNWVPLDRLKGLANSVFNALPKWRTKKSSGGDKRLVNATIIDEVPDAVVRVGTALKAFDLFVSLCSILLPRKPTACRDQILIQNVGMSDLFAIGAILAIPAMKSPVFHLIFRYAPDITASGYEAPERLASRLLDARQAARRKGGDIRFYSDSSMISEDFDHLLNGQVYFRTIPVPVFTKLPKRPFREPRPDQPLRIGMLGAPRIEKGFGEIPKIVEKLAGLNFPVEMYIQISRGTNDPRVRATIEWLDQYTLSGQANCVPIHLLEGPVDDSIYYSWFDQIDLIIFPYQSTRYKLSTSGVFVESVHFGILSIVPNNTWMKREYDKLFNNFKFNISISQSKIQSIRDAIYGND